MTRCDPDAKCKCSPHIDGHSAFSGCLVRFGPGGHQRSIRHQWPMLYLPLSLDQAGGLLNGHRAEFGDNKSRDIGENQRRVKHIAGRCIQPDIVAHTLEDPWTGVIHLILRL